MAQQRWGGGPAVALVGLGVLVALGVACAESPDVDPGPGPGPSTDAGTGPSTDAGTGPASDAGTDAGVDAGPPVEAADLWPHFADAGPAHARWGEQHRARCAAPTDFPRQYTHDAGAEYLCPHQPDAPVQLTTVTREGVEYERLHAACDTFEFVCRTPCRFDEATLRAAYAGFRAVKPELTHVLGMDTVPLRLPVTMHLTVDPVCPDPGPFAGYSFRGYPSGSTVCLFNDLNHALPDGGTTLTPEVAASRGSQVLELHEYGHTIFFSRHAWSYEFMMLATSFHVSRSQPDWADACGETYRHLAPPVWEACQRVGFRFEDLRPAFLALEADFLADRGTAFKTECGLRDTNMLQWRARLDPVVGASTAPAFLASDRGGYAALSVGDTRVVGPEGGTLTFADGRLTLQVPPGAVSAPTAVSQTFDTRYFRIPPPDPSGQDWSSFGSDNAMVFFPEDLDFQEPVRLTLRYEPRVLPAGGDARRLRLYTNTGNPEFGVLEQVAGSAVDVDAGVVTGDIRTGGLYFPAPLPP